MSRIVDFYTGAVPDHRGRFLPEILEWPDERLESVHDFIQGLFPLADPSPVNPHAPVIDRETVEAFAGRPDLRDALRTSFERMLRFYGLKLSPENTVKRMEHFAASAKNWLWPGNHNHLRITRILKCLHTLGLEDEAQAFWLALLELDKEYPGRVAPVTISFWRSAVTAPA